MNYKYKWQYNGAVEWNQLVDWCTAHFIVGEWFYDWETIEFKREEDYAFFMLKWS